MRIIAFATSFWRSKEEWDALWNGPIYSSVTLKSQADWLASWNEPRWGLSKWLDRVRWLFNPVDVFLACGTWSEPKWSPITVVNSGVDFTVPYHVGRWTYAGCAQTAAHAYLLNRRDWDLAVELDYDCLIGAVDFQDVMRQFLERPDLMMTPSWFGKPGGPFIMFKREGILRWMHQRKRADLIDDSKPDGLLLEDEFGEIFSGRWFNPWPDNVNQRYENGVTDDEARHWPFVRGPSATMIERYVKEETSQAKPLLAV